MYDAWIHEDKYYESDPNCQQQDLLKDKTRAHENIIKVFTHTYGREEVSYVRKGHACILYIHFYTPNAHIHAQ